MMNAEWKIKPPNWICCRIHGKGYKIAVMKVKEDEFAKTRNSIKFVIPAKAGIH